MIDKRPVRTTEFLGILQIYLLCAVPVCAIFFAIYGETEYIGMLMRSALLLPIFTVGVLLVARTKKLWCMVLLLALTALGCTLCGADAASRTIFFAMGCAACGQGLYERSRNEDTPFGFAPVIICEVFFIVCIAMSEYLQGSVPSTAMYLLAAAFLLCALTRLLCQRLELSLDRMSAKGTAPVRQIRRSSVRRLILVMIVIAVAALLMPQFGAQALVESISKGFAYLIALVFYVMSVLFASCDQSSTDGIPAPEWGGTASSQAATNESELFVAISYALFALLGILAAGYLLFSMGRMLVQFLLERYRKVGFKREDDAASEYDTIEQISIDSRPDKAYRRALAANTAEGKIRRIYRRTVEQLIRGGLSLEGGETCEEIAQLALANGTDICELTRVYCKARYSHGCTKEDVAFAASAAKKIRKNR